MNIDDIMVSTSRKNQSLAWLQIYAFAIISAIWLLLPLSTHAFVTTSDFPIVANNLVPGATVGGTLMVENMEANDLVLQVEGLSGSINALSDYLNISIVANGINYSDTLSNFISSGPITLGTVGGGVSRNVEMHLTLPINAPSTLMGSATNFDFCIGFKGEDPTCGSAFSTSASSFGGRSLGTATRVNSMIDAGPTPLVLGETTSAVSDCQEYLKSYIRKNAVNNRDDVIRLQEFLRDLGGYPNLQVTGQYDDATYEAVRSFQKNYRSSVLVPWGIAEPTGFVYYTTRKAINDIHCRFTKSFPLSNDQLLEIARLRINGEAWKPESTQPLSRQVNSSGAQSIPGGEVAGINTRNGDNTDATDNRQVTQQQFKSEPSAEPEAEKPSFFKNIWNWVLNWFR